MSSQNDQKARFEELGRKIGRNVGHAANAMEQESDRVIKYLNDEVVPAIRNGSSKGLRVAAEQLQKLAEYMDQNKSK